MSVIKTNSVCPFCDRSVQSSVFYARGEFMAIYNIAPVLPGHSLVIPKRHVTSLLDLNHNELCAFFETATITLRILMKAFHTDAFDWSIQEKPEAGQTIEHLHLHIVPRLKNDLQHPGNWYPLVQQNDQAIIDSPNRTKLDRQSMIQIIEVLKQTAAQMVL